MRYSSMLKSRKWLIAGLSSVLLLVAMACGAADTPEPVVITKEVPVEVIKEVEVAERIFNGHLESLRCLVGVPAIVYGENGVKTNKKRRAIGIERRRNFATDRKDY